MSRIKKAFPTLPVEFYDILCERLKAKGFTDERLLATVNGVIDTCKYPTPTVAHFMTFDEEHLCPFGFIFGVSHDSKHGCSLCEDGNTKVYWKCKTRQRDLSKKNDRT
jgi:hypothetical protein